MVTGNELIARTLARSGVDTFYFIMGGPMMGVESACLEHGLRGIDVRHEQAAVMMAHAHARLTGTPGIAMACSGPGTTNLVTGVAPAWPDGAPVVAMGGASPLKGLGTGAFQEVDQVAMMRPITRWAARVHDAARLPEYVAHALRVASGQLATPPGPVYLDLPGDVLYSEVEEAPALEVVFDPNHRVRPHADPESITEAVEAIARAERPIIVSGAGVLASGADATTGLTTLAERLTAPVFTTPQGRGVIPEDHELSLLGARSRAFREADVVLVVGTRANYVMSHFSEKRFASDAEFIVVDVQPAEIIRQKPGAICLAGDAAAVLGQLNAALGEGPGSKERSWFDELAATNREKVEAAEEALSTGAEPIHPLRLCKEVRDAVDRDAVVVVDGQEILNYARQSIPTFVPGHRLNSGTFGTMGVGLPFGIGAAVAKPGTQVVVLSGDGAFGMNAMEMDTAARHGVNLTVIISLNGGWTSDPAGKKPGRDLGNTQYHEMARSLGWEAELVSSVDAIQPTLERALACDRPFLINVMTDPMARASTTKFTTYAT